MRSEVFPFVNVKPEDYYLCQGGCKAEKRALEQDVGMSTADERRSGEAAATLVCSQPRLDARCCPLCSTDGASLSRNVLRESLELFICPARSKLHVGLD